MRTTTILLVGVITCKNGNVELIKISLPTLVYPPFVVYNKEMCIVTLPILALQINCQQ